MSALTALPNVVHGRITTPAELVDALGIPFSDEQLAAITAPLEPGVIIAGAGSGKTTVMAARVVWLVGTGAVAPEQVLGLTFTRKAAAELAGRVRDALARAGVIDTSGLDEAGEQVIMTYDAFAGRLVSEHGLRIGVEADPMIISGATRYRLAARVVAAAAGPFESISRLRPGTVTERVLRLDSELTQHLVDVERLDAQARTFALQLADAPLNSRGNPYAEVKQARVALTERLELASLARDYAALKRRLGVVEFADQMAIAAELAERVPAVSALLREQFAVVLLDEYQDTSAAQARMLAGLFSGPDPEHGRGHPVTAVGDPFQAIYGWRGAAASNITRFARDFPHVDGSPAQRFTLTVNRRSGQTILAAANRISEPLRAAGSDDGADTVLRAPADTPPGEVRVATFTGWPEEVGWLGERIAELVPRGGSGRAGGRRWSDIAVLVRRNADIGALYAELTGRDIPVEIVGLGGLLSLPEVADVVATLRVLHDVTANPDLIRLLTGPRWNIGPRDLAVLGQRAAELSGGQPAGEPDGLLAALAEAVADVDPTDLFSLADAVADPGEGPYSETARRRLVRFAAELDQLRRHSDEPVLDLTRRVIATVGLDVEVIADPAAGPGRQGRRDQLAAFCDAVADYVDVDGDASLGGLLAWVQAEQDSGTGLDQAVPSDADAVKLLTVHRAKGLEWEVVFLPALTQGTFPSDRVTDDWVKNPAVVPAVLRGDADSIPQLGGATAAAMKAYHVALGAEQQRAEDRLAYVAVTRAKRLLVATGHHWRAELVTAKQLSPYLLTLRSQAEATGIVGPLVDPPSGPNPLTVESGAVDWPQPWDPDGLARRRESADAVAAARARAASTGRYDRDDAEPLLLDQEQRLLAWDAEIAFLLDEARRQRRGVREVPVPSSLSATGLVRLNTDPDGFAADLARPMPHRPSLSATLGTRFHQWVEQFYGMTALLGVEESPDRAEDDIRTGAELASLCRAFEQGRFAARRPVSVEESFELSLGGRVIRGRVDAVFAEPDAAPDQQRYLLVDWKTSADEHADALQLGIYRIAWARLHGVAPEQVRAGFCWVRSDRFEEVRDLPDEAELERLLAGLGTTVS